MGVCRYALACANEATDTIEHPILGPVPVCQRCKEFYERQNG